MLSAFRTIALAFSALGAAIASASAVTSHRMPEASDLKRLGIDRDRFAAIRF